MLSSKRLAQGKPNPHTYRQQAASLGDDGSLFLQRSLLAQGTAARKIDERRVCGVSESFLGMRGGKVLANRTQCNIVDGNSRAVLPSYYY